MVLDWNWKDQRELIVFNRQTDREINTDVNVWKRVDVHAYTPQLCSLTRAWKQCHSNSNEHD